MYMAFPLEPSNPYMDQGCWWSDSKYNSLLYFICHLVMFENNDYLLSRLVNFSSPTALTQDRLNQSFTSYELCFTQNCRLLFEVIIV